MTNSFTLQPKPVDTHALFMTIGIAGGSAADGTKFDFAMTVSGGTLLLDVTLPDGTEVRQSLSTEALITAWVDAATATDGGES